MKYSLLIVVTILSASVDAQVKPFSASDFVRLEFPSSPVISPDGKSIAFTIRKADLEAGRWNTQIHLLTVSDGSIRPMTSSAASCTSPAWSPDGTWLTFTSSREYLDDNLRKQSGPAQLFGLPMRGGEARVWTQLASGVDEYKWSQDGRMIAILSESETPKKDEKSDWISSMDPKPGKDLWIFTVATMELQKTATLDRGASSLSWSPDNKTLAYQTNYTGEYNDEQKFDIWTIDLSGRKTQITSAPGPETKPRFSPDGKSIAYITQTVPNIEFAKTELHIMNAAGANSRNLTRDFPWSVTDFVWLEIGKSLVAVVNERVHNSLYMVDPVSGKMTKLADGDIVLSDVSASRDGLLATTIETGSTLREIATLGPGRLTTLTAFSKQIEGMELGSQEVITTKSRDGRFEIESVLLKPVGWTKGRRYPLVLMYHGGPYGDFDHKWYQVYPARLLAQAGIMCVMPNVRGSSGYTDEFSQANRYDLGGGDYRDAIDVVDWLIAQGMADSTRMGVMGGSYGGYMTNWTISQTQRFKAAVSMYGIFSWFTDWSNSWQPAFEQMYFGYNYWEKPIDMNSLWVNRAPQTFVQNITTPTLILQGTEDQYTNVSNSREMYQALKELGREVEFVTYPGAGHGIRTKPNQWQNVLERTVEWLGKRLTQP